jgi:hypothetical protein
MIPNGYTPEPIPLFSPYLYAPQTGNKTSDVCDRRGALSVMEVVRRLNRMQRALEELRADCRSTIELYEKNGPAMTAPSGAEYYSAGYVIESAEEKIATIGAALRYGEVP